MSNDSFIYPLLTDKNLFIHIYYQSIPNSMGNKNICGNFENEQRPPLNALGPTYDLSEQNTFKTVKPQYLKYPQKFPYVLTQLHQKNMNFTDEYFNSILNEQKIVGDEFYSYHNVLQITWKRSEQFVKSQQHKVTDRISTQNGNKISPMHKILYWIMQQPKLIKQIFKFQQIAKEGLVLVYLPYYGSQNNPIQIVIDNYLPTNNGNYVVPIPRYSPIGMLLIEKALAKLLGSYQSLRYKSAREIFQIVVGIPIIFQGLGLTDEVTILSKFYNPLYKVASIQQQLTSKHSQYMKINVLRTTNISISIWQIDQSQKQNELNKHSQIILQLIKKDNLPPGSFSRVGYASKLWQNKTILRATSPQDQSIKNAKQFLTLEQGDYYLHIFSQSDKNSIIANIIVYSEFQNNLLFRKDSHDLNQIKKAMIYNVFHSRAKMKPLEEFLQCWNVKSKFVWDGYRGILCLNCNNKSQNLIKIQILPEYRKKIKFEQSGQFQVELQLLHQNKIVTFIKLSKDIGRFYKISLVSR